MQITGTPARANPLKSHYGNGQAPSRTFSICHPEVINT
ncbi:hypothetical protein CES85_3014 (plasmid) [Ochrobactrum quorumnocens]|uniref:Uncharacterized protein n=1 Tax=Ochrobactrum quorumnocens TaxID=271865 RepID=A0A248UQG1_9HYPH|nr:hypothetical protein CES85_3014 [[Ochrobactrum] quorumnocens]